MVSEKSVWTLQMSHPHVLMIDVLASFAKSAMLIALFSLMELWDTEPMAKKILAMDFLAF